MNSKIGTGKGNKRQTHAKRAFAFIFTATGH